MEQKDLQLLAEIYNNLLTVSVKGDDIFVMSECMKALRQFVYSKQQEVQDKKQNLDRKLQG